MENKIQQFKQLVNESNNIVFFGGAGVSTESGIPDFRSKDGLYNQKYDYPPEEILSHTFFINHTDAFYKFYKDKMNSLKYEPNITHIKIAELEKKGKIKAIVTQNIDGLHQKAGSKNVYELHGSVLKNYCMKCHKFYDAEYVFTSKGIPKCTCGGIIKPDVVLYEEALDERILLLRGELVAPVALQTFCRFGAGEALFGALHLPQYLGGVLAIVLHFIPSFHKYEKRPTDRRFSLSMSLVL